MTFHPELPIEDARSGFPGRVRRPVRVTLKTGDPHRTWTRTRSLIYSSEHAFSTKKTRLITLVLRSLFLSVCLTNLMIDIRLIHLSVRQNLKNNELLNFVKNFITYFSYLFISKFCQSNKIQ